MPVRLHAASPALVPVLILVFALGACDKSDRQRGHAKREPILAAPGETCDDETECVDSSCLDGHCRVAPMDACLIDEACRTGYACHSERCMPGRAVLEEWVTNGRETHVGRIIRDRSLDPTVRADALELLNEKGSIYELNRSESKDQKAFDEVAGELCKRLAAEKTTAIQRKRNLDAVLTLLSPAGLQTARRCIVDWALSGMTLQTPLDELEKRLRETELDQSLDDYGDAALRPAAWMSVKGSELWRWAPLLSQATTLEQEREVLEIMRPRVLDTTIDFPNVAMDALAEYKSAEALALFVDIYTNEGFAEQYRWRYRTNAMRHVGEAHKLNRSDSGLKTLNASLLKMLARKSPADRLDALALLVAIFDDAGLDSGISGLNDDLDDYAWEDRTRWEDMTLEKVARQTCSVLKNKQAAKTQLNGWVLKGNAHQKGFAAACLKALQGR